MRLESIGYIETPYLTKFGVPRQPELASDIDCTLVVDIAFFDDRLCASAVPGAYLWVIWSFSKNEQAVRKGFSPTVRPPLLGGTKRVGVLATRSSYRPNNLALSALRVTGTAVVNDGSLRIPLRGADAVDGTPVFAVYPYLPSVHACLDASAGWIERTPWQKLEVSAIDEDELAKVDERYRTGLVQLLEQDPRPAYTRCGREDRVFWVPYANVVACFKVSGVVLQVTRIESLTERQVEQLRETGTMEFQ